MNYSRKKPGWAFGATVALIGVPVLYVVSFGPACWLNHATGIGTSAIPVIYRPIVRLAARQVTDPPIYQTRWNPIIVWYARLGIVGEYWPCCSERGLHWANYRSDRTW